jgi:hypothetical protein
MLTAIITLVSVAIALVVLLIAIVAAGIRREPPTAELASRAPSQLATAVRRLLGVYVSRTDQTATHADLVGHTPSRYTKGQGR